MKTTAFLTPSDRQQLSRAGISVSEIERQLEIFRQPKASVRLIRPCTSGDGVRQFSEDQQTEYLRLWQALAQQSRLAKFIPASGAATRMFKELAQLQEMDRASSESSRGELVEGRRSFCQSIRQQAFYPVLEKTMEKKGQSLDALVEKEELSTILNSLLDDQGLGYRSLPKALIPFHSYPGEARTAALEHLWEGAEYLAESGGTGRLHFTIASDHEATFAEHIHGALDRVRSELGIGLEVDFSTQSLATDTIAVDLQNEIFRQADDSLLLRPAGHGALVKNLQEIDADVVFIKNIDNVSHRRLHPISVHWKRILAGYFFSLQTHVFEILSQLEGEEDPKSAIERAEWLAAEELAFEIPQTAPESSPQRRREMWIHLLDRPLRVCGVVKNTGEPGGGPFWLHSEDRLSRGQIVESAQIDLSRSDQAAQWNRSTHFNPVDLVCGLRDRHGTSYRLEEFVDPSTTFVTQKSHRGLALKTMERPGLWNGAMAHWNTAFVEVPLQTFTPVKTIFDLLRPEHQP